MKTTESALQDYLDERMDAEERRAFERRIAREPELAGLLAEHLRLRDDLQKEEALPPGFYTRTRAEFQRRAGARKPFPLRVLSWEAVGLAAAAGLALALFVPVLVRDELPRSPTLEEGLRSQQVAQPADEPPHGFADRDTTETDELTGDVVSKSVAGLGKARDAEEAGEAETFEERQAGARRERPSATPAEPKRDQKLEGPSAGSGRDDDPGEPTATSATISSEPGAATEGRAVRDDARKKQVFAPSPPSPQSEDAPPPPAGQVAQPKPVAQADRVDSEAQSERAPRRSSDLAAQEAPRPVLANPLREGSIPRHAVRSMETANARELFVRDDEESDLSKDADARRFALEDRSQPAERAVLIGARDMPFSCVGVRLATSPNEHVVILGRVGPGSPVAAAGCAVILPADDRAIVVVDPPRDAERDP